MSLTVQVTRLHQSECGSAYRHVCPASPNPQSQHIYMRHAGLTLPLLCISSKSLHLDLCNSLASRRAGCRVPELVASAAPVQVSDCNITKIVKGKQDIHSSSLACRVYILSFTQPLS